MTKADPLNSIETAFREYLEESMKPCFELKKGQAQYASRTPNEISGSIVAAFDALAYPEGNDKAKRFIERYNDVCIDFFDGEWNIVKNLQYTYVYKPEARDIMFCVAATEVIKDLLCDQNPMVLQILESERHVIYLHFHQFLEKVWRHAEAAEKERASKERCHTGTFGNTRFSTWNGIGVLSFQFSDVDDDSRSVSFAAELVNGDNSGYNAKLSSCYVDVIKALQMIREVTEKFDIKSFRPTSQYTWYLWNCVSAK